MPHRKFKPNNIVKSLSGGPEMRVIKYYRDHSASMVSAVGRINDAPSEETTLVICQWFDVQNFKHWDKFEENTLELAAAK